MEPRCRRALVMSAVVVMLAGPFARPLLAQTSQPIYPVYDGFVRNPDGTLILSFAYFSHNSEPITIPAGPGNAFSHEPVDRQQTTTFLPGHHRFQCIMVVGPEFDGKLRWTVSHGGTTTATSENMLQYSWELDESAARQAKRGIDPIKAPRGVCLNRPPIVRMLGLAAAPAGPDGENRPGSRGLAVLLSEEARLFGSVDDEGLPRGAKMAVAWKKISGPGAVTFSDPTAARTRASFSEPGTYQLELSANDSERESRLQLTVTVKP